MIRNKTFTDNTVDIPKWYFIRMHAQSSLSYCVMYGNKQQFLTSGKPVYAI